MNPLTPAEHDELGELLADFVTNRRFDGLDCIVILDGRGLHHVAYAQDIQDKALTLVAKAFMALKSKQAPKDLH